MCQTKKAQWQCETSLSLAGSLASLWFQSSYCQELFGKAGQLIKGPTDLPECVNRRVERDSEESCLLSVILITINIKVEYVPQFYGLETFIAILYNREIKHGRIRIFKIIDFYDE